MQGLGGGVNHAPDIILRDFDKAGTFVLIDIKTLDAAGPSHVAAHHTDRARLTAHLAIATHSRRNQYGDLPPNMRLVILAVSSCGAINPEGHTFISSLAQRMDNSIPPALASSPSVLGNAEAWPNDSHGPFGFAVRRGQLAAAVHRWWRHVPSLGLAPLLLRQRPRQLDDDSSSDSEASQEAS